MMGLWPASNPTATPPPIIEASGLKNIEVKSSAAVTRLAKPVRAPSETPAADSI
jgi:hypothetical protein